MKSNLLVLMSLFFTMTAQAGNSLQWQEVCTLVTPLKVEVKFIRNTPHEGGYVSNVLINGQELEGDASYTNIPSQMDEEVTAGTLINMKSRKEVTRSQEPRKEDGYMFLTVEFTRKVNVENVNKEFSNNTGLVAGMKNLILQCTQDSSHRDPSAQ